MTLEALLSSARTHHAFLDRPVEPELLRKLYNEARWGPTAANCQPARFVFITTPAAKERLYPTLMPTNVEQTRQAPVNVIVASDTQFYEYMPRLFPAYDIGAKFRAEPAMAEETAFRNSTLQGGYFILAARAMGLDCGPMSGFEPAKLNAEFFPDGRWKANFLLNLGYGDTTHLYPRGPRLEFDEACRIE